jgi:hypothetical protein
MLGQSASDSNVSADQSGRSITRTREIDDVVFDAARLADPGDGRRPCRLPDIASLADCACVSGTMTHTRPFWVGRGRPGRCFWPAAARHTLERGVTRARRHRAASLGSETNPTFWYGCGAEVGACHRSPGRSTLGPQLERRPGRHEQPIAPRVAAARADTGRRVLGSGAPSVQSGTNITSEVWVPTPPQSATGRRLRLGGW